MQAGRDPHHDLEIKPGRCGQGDRKTAVLKRVEQIARTQGPAQAGNTGRQHLALPGTAQTVAEMGCVVELDDKAAGRPTAGLDLGQSCIQPGDHLVGHRPGVSRPTLAPEGKHGERKRHGKTCQRSLAPELNGEKRQKRQQGEDLPGVVRQVLQRLGHAGCPRCGGQSTR